MCSAWHLIRAQKGENERACGERFDPDESAATAEEDGDQVGLLLRTSILYLSGKETITNLGSRSLVFFFQILKNCMNISINMSYSAVLESSSVFPKETTQSEPCAGGPVPARVRYQSRNRRPAAVCVRCRLYTVHGAPCPLVQRTPYTLVAIDFNFAKLLTTFFSKRWQHFDKEMIVFRCIGTEF